MVCHAKGFVLALLEEQLEFVSSAACSVHFPCRLSLSSSALWWLHSAFRYLLLPHCPLLSDFCFVFYRSLPGWVTKNQQHKPAVCRPVMKPAPCSESKVVCCPLCASFHSTGDANIVDFKYNDVDLVPHQLTIRLRGTNKHLCFVSRLVHISYCGF